MTFICGRDVEGIITAQKEAAGFRRVQISSWRNQRRKKRRQDERDSGALADGGMGGGHFLWSYSYGSVIRRVESEGKRNLARCNPEIHSSLDHTQNLPLRLLSPPGLCLNDMAAKSVSLCVCTRSHKCVLLIC